MISYLEGNIQKKLEKAVIVNVNGVGYLVQVPETVLTEAENEISLYIHTHVREDDISLFGFPTLAELKFFKQLISVSGIGPKTGLEFLNIDPSLIKSAILNGDIAVLSRTPGIGKKTAERMILELKNKIDPTDIREHQPITAAIDEDALEALISLGYSRGQVYRILGKANAEFESTEDCIKYFLQNV